MNILNLAKEVFTGKKARLSIKLGKNGFLLDESIKGEIRSKNAELFSSCEQLNREIIQKASSAIINLDNLQEILTFSLFLRISSLYQGVLLTSELGMYAEPRILLRSMLETLFSLCFVVSNEKNTEKYAIRSFANKKKLLNKLKSTTSSVIKDIRSNISDEQIEELNRIIKEVGAEELKTITLATESGLTDHYHTAYSLLSESVHSTADDLENHLLLDENREAIGFKFEPCNKDIAKNLISAEGYLSMAEIKAKEILDL